MIEEMIADVVERRTIVHLPCSSYEIETSLLDCLDISEGMQGEDILTYICPVCEGQHQSTVYRK